MSLTQFSDLYDEFFNRRILEISTVFPGLDRPRAIVAHYDSGRVFWTDWGVVQPRIEVADLDGRNRDVFVGDEVQWPNGLCIDWSSRELFWTDAKLNR